MEKRREKSELENKISLLTEKLLDNPAVIAAVGLLVITLFTELLSKAKEVFSCKE